MRDLFLFHETALFLIIVEMLAVATEVIKRFKWQAERVHVAMAPVAFRRRGNVLDPLPEGPVRIVRHLRVDRDRYVRDAPC